MIFACRVHSPSFCDHVLHVFRARSQDQMRGIYAARIVAGVQDAQLAWRPAVQRNGDPVRVRRAAPNAHLSVAVAISVALPRPAFVWCFSINFLPKARNYLFIHDRLRVLRSRHFDDAEPLSCRTRQGRYAGWEMLV
jgi:hypothetical protein